MSMYNYNSIVSNSEQEALKDMIFKRARERAQSFTDDVQASYTSSVQNEVMDIARDSFVSNKNPFSLDFESKASEEPSKKVEEAKQEEIGFARRNVKEIKAQIVNKNKNTNTDIANREVESMMSGARADFACKQSFMGALEFLNSQASITLVSKKGKNFEALA